jgi:hypothetical protein
MKVVDSTNRVTVADIWKAVGEEVTTRWETLGQMDSKVHWQYGAEAAELIDEFPAMAVYKAIAIKAGKSSQTIRKAYYTFKAFDAETRVKYEACPYSIFQHARTQDNPIDILEYYINNRSSVDEVEAVYPEIENRDFENEFQAQGISRIFYGVYREVYGIEPFLKARVMEHIKEIEAIIKQVNQ